VAFLTTSSFDRRWSPARRPAGDIAGTASAVRRGAAPVAASVRSSDRAAWSPPVRAGADPLSRKGSRAAGCVWRRRDRRRPTRCRVWGAVRS
jgi:hypothetical protein